MAEKEKQLFIVELKILTLPAKNDVILFFVFQKRLSFKAEL
jgi:hypothetical protein